MESYALKQSQLPGRRMEGKRGRKKDVKGRGEKANIPYIQHISLCIVTASTVVNEWKYSPNKDILK